MKIGQTIAVGIAAIGSAFLSQAPARGEVDFMRQVKPVLESACLGCHNAQKAEGDLRLDTEDRMLKGSGNGEVVVPGNPEESVLYTLTVLPADDDDVMPPKGEKLSPAQSEALRQWIAEGARWPDNVILTQVPRISFVRDIQPILEVHCVGCHREDKKDGGLDLSTRKAAFAGGDTGDALVPFDSSESIFYTLTILSADEDDLMPPTNRGGPLPREMTDLIKTWIDQGAVWPEDVKLIPRRAAPKEVANGEAAEVGELYKRILNGLASGEGIEMRPYTEKISGTGVTFDLVPIPGGEFVMGSPPNEPGRKGDEGPQHKVTIDPFWMGKCEVTWNEFELFMYPSQEKRLRAIYAQTPKDDPVVDAIARPTQPYVEMSFGMGKDGYPAISMTQHAANIYCQWLSAHTGHYYRLPTEAEWEYACRAGTTTAYSWGDDVSQIDEYAWYEENSDWKYQKVGKKKPNPWGLYDMHGNVAEWTLDQYAPDYYQQFKDKVAHEPWNEATTLYPRVVRGGSWDDPPEMLRSAARRASGSEWKLQDPQLPKSIWYHTDAQFVGFRVIRPLRVPPPDEMRKYWTTAQMKE